MNTDDVHINESNIPNMYVAPVVVILLVMLLIPRRVRGHSMRSVLFRGTYSHTLVFSSVRVVLSVTFICRDYGLMIFD